MDVVLFIGIIPDVAAAPVHHFDALFLAVEIAEDHGLGIVFLERGLPFRLEEKRIQQDHERPGRNVVGRQQVLDHVLRVVLDVGVHLRDEETRLREVLLVERPVVILLDHGDKRGEDVLFIFLFVPDGVRHQDLDLFVRRVFLRNRVEELAAFRRIIGESQRVADLLRGPLLRAAVDQPERAVDAVRGDKRVFLRVLVTDQAEEIEPLAVQIRGDGFPIRGRGVVRARCQGQGGQQGRRGKRGGGKSSCSVGNERETVKKRCLFHGWLLVFPERFIIVDSDD